MVRLIICLILAAHGVGHIMGFMAAWTPAAGPFQDKPWVFSDGVTMESVLGKVLGLLWLATCIGFLAGAYGLWRDADWWRPVLIASAAASLLLVLPWWGAMPRGSYLGALAVDLLVLWALLTGGDRIARALGVA